MAQIYEGASNGYVAIKGAAGKKYRLKKYTIDTQNTVPLAKGGTGAATAADARANLGLGDLAEYDSVTTGLIRDLAVTNDKLAGSITNAKLSNSSITINGSPVSLGGSVTLADSSGGLTDGYTDGTNNLLIGSYDTTNLGRDVTVFGQGTLAGTTNAPDYTTIIGSGAGAALTSGSLNTFMGWQAGDTITTGQRNTFIGERSGEDLGGASNRNVAVGGQTLHTKGNLGVTHTYNTAVGYYAGGNIGGAATTVDFNTFIGSQAGYNCEGDYNVYIGFSAGFNADVGSNNIVIGKNAEKTSTNTSNEITLGDANIDKFRIPGLDFEIDDDGLSRTVLRSSSGGGLYLEATSGDVTLDPAGNEIRINDNGVARGFISVGTADTLIVYTGTNTKNTTFSGADITVEGDVTSLSDIRHKENIETIDGAIDIVSALRGVRYDRIDHEGRKVGVIAQEVEEVLPEVVKTDATGVKSVDYGKIVGVLIEAIKDLKAEIDELKS